MVSVLNLTFVTAESLANLVRERARKCQNGSIDILARLQLERRAIAHFQFCIRASKSLWPAQTEIDRWIATSRSLATILVLGSANDTELAFFDIPAWIIGSAEQAKTSEPTTLASIITSKNGCDGQKSIEILSRLIIEEYLRLTQDASSRWYSPPTPLLPILFEDIGRFLGKTKFFETPEAVVRIVRNTVQPGTRAALAAALRDLWLNPSNWSEEIRNDPDIQRWLSSLATRPTAAEFQADADAFRYFLRINDDFLAGRSFDPPRFLWSVVSRIRNLVTLWPNSLRIFEAVVQQAEMRFSVSQVNAALNVAAVLAFHDDQEVADRARSIIYRRIRHLGSAETVSERGYHAVRNAYFAAAQADGHSQVSNVIDIIHKHKHEDFEKIVHREWWNGDDANSRSAMLAKLATPMVRNKNVREIDEFVLGECLQPAGQAGNRGRFCAEPPVFCELFDPETKQWATIGWVSSNHVRHLIAARTTDLVVDEPGKSLRFPVTNDTEELDSANLATSALFLALSKMAQSSFHISDVKYVLRSSRQYNSLWQICERMVSDLRKTVERNHLSKELVRKRAREFYPISQSLTIMWIRDSLEHCKSTLLYSDCAFALNQRCPEASK